MTQAKPTRKEMTDAAHEIDEATQRYLASGLDNFRDDGEMEAMFRSDASDLRLVATWLREGNLGFALATADNLSAASQDVISTITWELLNR